MQCTRLPDVIMLALPLLISVSVAAHTCQIAPSSRSHLMDNAAAASVYDVSAKSADRLQLLRPVPTAAQLSWWRMQHRVSVRPSVCPSVTLRYCAKTLWLVPRPTGFVLLSPNTSTRLLHGGETEHQQTVILWEQHCIKNHNNLLNS